MCLRRGSERLPHVHHGQANARTLLLAKPAIEFRHARLRAILAAKPDRPTPQQIADHDSISVPLADCDLINADGERTRRARALKLRLHVLHLQRLDSVPVELQLLGNVRDRRLPATASDKIRKALGVQRITARKSSCSRFTLPQRRQSMRRTSSSSNIRLSPHDRSRTCRILPSYQPIWTWPQHPQAVFLSVV